MNPWLSADRFRHREKTIHVVIENLCGFIKEREEAQSTAEVELLYENDEVQISSDMILYELVTHVFLFVPVFLW